ncbi:MAG: tRNA pseudouridine(55) synthase TruB [Pyrinomonadaceae bacterium]
MDGILIIDKPAGMTSHDVVSRVRRVLKTRRVGHTGTLDPFATGVMVIVIGRATRLAQVLDKDEKEYVAALRLGFETDTGDLTGTPRTPAVNLRTGNISLDEINGILAAFRGSIEQTPPMFSAKKIDGRKMYELARKGLSVERKAVRVDIRELELLDPDVGFCPDAVLSIRVACSAGTYIRTLAEDIGRRLGTGAHLDELRRIRAGRFEIAQGYTLEALDGSNDAASLMLRSEAAVEHLAKFVLAEDRVLKTKNGLSTRLASAEYCDGQTIAMFASSGDLVAVGKYKKSDECIQPAVVLI